MRLLVLLLALSALASCSDPQQINLILDTNDRPEAAAQIASNVASRTGMKLERREFEYGGPDGTQVSIALHGFDTAVIVQSDLKECPRLDPCFSATKYMVSIYAKWPWISNAALGDLADAVRDGAEAQGATVALMPGSRNDVPTWQP